MDKMNVKGQIKAFLPGIILVMIAVAIFIFNVSLGPAYKATLTAKDVEIQQLTIEAERARTVRAATVRDAQLTITGLNTQRVHRDDGIMSKFLSECLTWTNEEEYTAARDNVQKNYNKGSNGNRSLANFLDVFLPPLPVIKDVSGKTYTQFPDGLNMSYADMTSHVTNIKGDAYSYFSEVTVSSRAFNGAIGLGYCIVSYTIDESGSISNLNAYTLAE